MADKDLVSEVLDRLIDSQISNTQALTALRSTLSENNERLKDLDGFFRNGFRSDIKTMILELSDASKERDQLKSLIDSVENITRSKIGSVENITREIKHQNQIWMKVVATIVGVGTIAAVIIKLID